MVPRRALDRRENQADLVGRFGPNKATKLVEHAPPYRLDAESGFHRADNNQQQGRQGKYHIVRQRSGLRRAVILKERQNSVLEERREFLQPHGGSKRASGALSRRKGPFDGSPR